MTTFIKIFFSEIILIAALSACSSTTDERAEETVVAVETYLPTASHEDGFFCKRNGVGQANSHDKYPGNGVC